MSRGAAVRGRCTVLSARLARLALEADELAERISSEPLTSGDELLLSAPTAHLALALASLERLLDQDEPVAVTADARRRRR